MIVTKNPSDPIYSTCFDSTTARTGVWNEILITETAAFTTLTDANRDGDAITGISFSAGTVLQGNFTAITLASGSCIAYYK